MPTCEVYTELSPAIRSSLIPTKVVGLTGRIATGKYCLATFCEKSTIDADILAHQVDEAGTRGYKKIVQAFGEEEILQDGSGKIDRKKLGKIVFGDEGKRLVTVLNGIVHRCGTGAASGGKCLNASPAMCSSNPSASIALKISLRVCVAAQSTPLPSSASMFLNARP